MEPQHKAVVRLLTLMCFIGRAFAGVLINELNADSPSLDTQEFIELYNNGVSQVSLNDYVIVLYDGTTDTAYAVIPLQGGSISPYGYYVIGSSAVSPRPDRTLESNINIIQNGADAVALYHGDVSQFTEGMAVTSASLVDAVVYDKRGRVDSGLIDVLTPNERTLDEWSGHLQGEDESLSRCQGMDPLKLSQFQLTPLTPGALNNCTADTLVPTTNEPQNVPDFPHLPSFPPVTADLYPDIVINEFSVDSGSGQFIELYDGGIGGVTLDGLVIATYKGRTEASYGNPIRLSGLQTDEGGYFLIGHASLQPHLELPRTLRTNRPPNAIALYFEDPNNLGTRTPVTGVNLVDAVVYGDAQNPFDSALVNVLSPGRLPLLQPTNQVNTSLSRCKSWQRLNLDAFTRATQTPAGDNLCTLPDFFINEVNVAVNGELTNQFIEIFDGGIGQQPLDGIAVVLYNGKTSNSYQSIDLTGHSTNKQGFCVVGWVNGTNVDVGVEFDPVVGFLQPGPDAVALHLGPTLRFRHGSTVTNYNLIDAIVYGQNPAFQLLHTLLPYQQVLNEVGGSTSSGDQSISRCSCCQHLNSTSFGIGPTTPGTLNVDCLQNNVTHIESLDSYVNLIRLNEIRIAKLGLPRGDFVEIYDGGFGGMSLDNMVLVLYRSDGESSYKAIDLNGYRTDSNGFFVIGPQAIQPSAPLIEEVHWFQEEIGAVAIHKGSSADFPTGTRPSLSSLVDAVVYGDSNLLLLDLLTPGQSQLNYSVSTGETSILRCYSRDAFEVIAYVVGPPSPGEINNCPPPPIVINEVNVMDESQNIGEYVELSSGGIPRFPLNDMLLLFWKGSNSVSYRSIKISGKRTDRNGLFLLGYRGLSSPRPDLTPFNVPNGKIREGTNAISLHMGLKKEDYPKRSPLTRDGLVDVIIYGSDDSEIAQHLINFFRPGALQINEQAAWSERDESINRCFDSQLNAVYQLAHVTPKAPNHCPSRSDASLIINELNLIPSEQFIELWDLGAGFTSLDDFVVVLFGEGDVSYWNIRLTGFTTDSMGYFVMGAVSVLPRPQFLFADGFMRHNYGAVALYRVSSATSFPESAPPSSQGLIDAVVYTNMDSNPAALTNVLTPAFSAIDSRSLQTSGFSLSRCLSPVLRSPRPFVSQPQTPKTFNDCPVYSSDVVINEVNVEHPGQSSQKEFIELYDGGVGNTKLRYLSLVLFNGHSDDRSYLTVNLHGRRTDLNGFFLIGAQDIAGANLILRPQSRGGFLQDGPDAIALYRAPPGAFPHGTEASPRSLVDAIVYSTEGKEHVSLVDKLIPGRSVVLEDANHATGDETISRCYGNQRLSPDVYSMGLPTPGRSNNCSSMPSLTYPDIRISEVNVEASDGGDEFVELSGRPASSLKGFLLVLFNGANQDRSYLEVDLSGYSINARGLFVIGTSGINPAPDIIVHNNFLQDGPDAVALYQARARVFPRGTIATTVNMVDVLIYTTNNATDDSMLLDKLAPGQRAANEYRGYLDGDESLSRCLSNRSKTLSAFTVSWPTPGQANNCTVTPVVINEIKLDSDMVGFIELYDGGRGSTPLDSLSLVLYDSGDNGLRMYFTQSLLGKATNRNGYFVCGKPSSEWTVDLEISSSPSSDFLHNDGSSAVALYKNQVNGRFTDQSTLIDVLVYGPRNPVGTAVIDALIPGQSQVQTNSEFSQGDMSISRCICCVPLLSSVFAVSQPSPGQDNSCMVGTTAATPTSVMINEVSPWTGRTEYKEYIELRGPPGTRLDGYTLVLASSSENGPFYYFTLSLSQRAIASDGMFVIGTSGVTPPADALFPQSLGAVIRPGEGAVVIYRGVQSQFREGAPVTNSDVVDAMVFTNTSSQTSSQLSSILTPGFDSIYTKNFSTLADIATPSISRCACCQGRDASVFMLSAQTPGQTNQCPRGRFRRKIQMHILDAAFEVWKTTPQLTTDLRKKIAAGVNAECKCGFQEYYLKDEKLFSGSVYYQADMLAVSPGHAKFLYDSYVSFVSKTDTLNILGTDFHIDKQCFSDCLSRGNASRPDSQTAGKDGGPVAAVAVAIIVVVIVAVVAVMLYIFLRHRKRVLSYVKNRGKLACGAEGEFRVTNKHTLSDLDVLGTISGTRGPSDFFANPVYLYEPPKVPVPQPEPPMKAGAQKVSDGKMSEESTTQAKEENATERGGVQS